MFGSLQWPEVVATYAALVSTGALALEIRRWVESKVRLRVDATANMLLFNVPGISRNEKWVAVSAVNIGTVPVTITGMGIVRYKSRLHRLFRRAKGHAVVVSPQIRGDQPNIPRLLSPGEVWRGFMPQNAELEHQLTSEVFLAGVWGSDRKRARYCQVIWREKRDKQRA